MATPEEQTLEASATGMTNFADKRPDVSKNIQTAGLGKEIFGLFAAVSFDEASTFAIVRLVSDDSRTSHDVESNDGHIFQMNQTHAEPLGYISARQDQKSGMIHAITSRQHYQFNYAWLIAGKGEIQTRNTAGRQ